MKLLTKQNVDKNTSTNIVAKTSNHCSELQLNASFQFLSFVTENTEPTLMGGIEKNKYWQNKQRIKLENPGIEF